MPRRRGGAKVENFTAAEMNAIREAAEEAIGDRTQQRFADDLGVSQQTISRVLSKKHLAGITRPNAEAIAKAAGYASLADLFTERGVESVGDLPKPTSAYDGYPELRMAVFTARTRFKIPEKTIQREIEKAGGPNVHWRSTRWIAAFANAWELEQDVLAEAELPAPKRKRALA